MQATIDCLRKVLRQVFAIRNFSGRLLSMSALQVLRTCLGSHVRQTIAHGMARLAVPSQRLPNARSFTSDKGKDKENATADVDEQKEKAATDGPVAAPKTEADDVAAKLQAKQDEIIELTVRPLSFTFHC